jgi:hypothetical protein
MPGRPAPVKILHVIPTLSPASGGPPEALRHLSRAYGEVGVQVEIVSQDDPRRAVSGEFPYPGACHGRASQHLWILPRTAALVAAECSPLWRGGHQQHLDLPQASLRPSLREGACPTWSSRMACSIPGSSVLTRSSTSRSASIGRSNTGYCARLRQSCSPARSSAILRRKASGPNR